MRVFVWVAVACLLSCGGTSPVRDAQGGPPSESNSDGGTPATKPVEASFNLRVQVQGLGSVASSPSGIACAQSCQAVFLAGTSVLLTATPAAQQKFTGWTGACSGTAMCVVTADANVVANFVALPPPVPKHTLKISVGGAGNVISQPAGILCGTTCAASFDEGSVVMLSQTPGSGAQFNTWTGACSGAGPCSVTMTADLEVRAWFDRAPNAASCVRIRAADPVRENGTAWGTTPAWSCLPPVGDALGELVFAVVDPQHLSTNAVVFNADFHGISDVLAGLYLSGVTRLQQQSTGFFAWKQGTLQDPGAITVSYWARPQTAYALFASVNGLFRPGVFAVEGSLNGLMLVGELDTGTPAVVHGVLLLRANQNAVPEVAWGPIHLASEGTPFGAGVDAVGRTLVITDGSAKFGAGAISGEWLGPDGVPLTGEFLLQAGFVPAANTWFEASALIGGGVIVWRMDLDALGKHSRALVTVAGGETDVAPAPGWMTARPDTRLKIVRGGTAYAVLPLGAKGVACSQRVELVAPDGTFCSASTYAMQPGTCDTAELTMGEDGTVLQTSPPIFSTDSQGNHYMSCTWQWWTGTLR